MKLNAGDIISGLRGALGAVEKLAPMAQAFGAPAIVANVATIAVAAAATAENILDRAGEAKRVFSSEDQEEIRSIIAELAAHNDKLNSAVAAS